MNKTSNNKLKYSILSLSLLTIMATAAISPALGPIKEHFNDINPTLIKMFVFNVPHYPFVIASFVAFIYLIWISLLKDNNQSKTG